MMGDALALAWVSRMQWQADCIIAASLSRMPPRKAAQTKAAHAPLCGLHTILPKLPSLTGAPVFVPALSC